MFQKRFYSSRKIIFKYSVIYSIIFIFFYAIIPVVILSPVYPESSKLLSDLTIVSVITVLISSNITLTNNESKYILVDFSNLINITFFIFLLLVLITFITAPSIPIIESLKGASQNELSIHRENFLKNRSGWELILSYLIELFTQFFLPYLVAYSYYIDHKNKKIYILFFSLFCVSFLAKAYFLKIFIPIFFIEYSKSKNKVNLIIKGAILIFFLLFFMYFVSGNRGGEATTENEFFSTLYTPNSIIESIIWRSIVIPVITAIDGMNLFIFDLNGKFLLGDTSSIIAFLKGNERINFERLVYQNQFGGSDTGNANCYYLVEAFVNFGILGVITFSLFVGYIIKLFVKKNDTALMGILPLFLLNIFNVGLISLFFSGGFFILFFFIKLFKFKNG